MASAKVQQVFLKAPRSVCEKGKNKLIQMAVDKAHENGHLNIKASDIKIRKRWPSIRRGILKLIYAGGDFPSLQITA